MMVGVGVGRGGVKSGVKVDIGAGEREVEVKVGVIEIVEDIGRVAKAGSVAIGKASRTGVQLTRTMRVKKRESERDSFRFMTFLQSDYCGRQLPIDTQP